MNNTLTRRQIVDSILYGFRMILPLDMYNPFEDYLLNMSDKDLQQAWSVFNHYAEENGLIREQCVDASVFLAKSLGPSFDNTALNRFPVRFLPEAENNEIWRRICASSPSSTIYLDTAADIAICKIVENSHFRAGSGLLSDYLLDGKIRLLDCNIEVDERDLPDGLMCSFRVVVFPDYQERLKEERGDGAIVGALVYYLSQYPFFIPIVASRNSKVLMCRGVGYHNAPAELLRLCKEEWTEKIIGHLFFLYMSSWYGIQISLNDPELAKLFKKPAYGMRTIIYAEDVRAAVRGRENIC